MKTDTVLFDLDGTITDSAPGIINSIRYSLEKHGIAVLDEQELRKFVGPPLQQQFQKVFGVMEKEARQMMDSYREYYGTKGMYENRVYEGVPRMLSRPQSAGIRILMATSKPEKYARMIAEHFGFTKYFEYIGGACMDGTRTMKYDVIEYVLDVCKVTDRERVVMVGDRCHDMIGAQQAGLHRLGVLYGYGSQEELEQSGAESLAKTPQNVAEYILLTPLNV